MSHSNDVYVGVIIELLWKSCQHLTMMTSSNGNIFRVTTGYWPSVRGIHRSPVNSPHKGQWRGALIFSLICTRINCWVNNGEAGDLRRHRAHYDVIVMMQYTPRIMHTVRALLCFVEVQLISFTGTGVIFKCFIANVATLKDIGILIIWFTGSWWDNHNKKAHKIVCIFHGLYIYIQ